MCRYHCEFSLSRCDEQQVAASPCPGSCTDLLSLELEAVMDQPGQAALPSSRREARAFNRDNLSRAVGHTWIPYYSQSRRKPLLGPSPG